MENRSIQIFVVDILCTLSNTIIHQSIFLILYSLAEFQIPPGIKIGYLFSLIADKKEMLSQSVLFKDTMPFLYESSERFIVFFLPVCVACT